VRKGGRGGRIANLKHCDAELELVKRSKHLDQRWKESCTCVLAAGARVECGVPGPMEHGSDAFKYDEEFVELGQGTDAGA